ncbi:MAG: hypothetical protein NZ700_13235 [Gemmataceae bacterium]|nr:hypothetical protein [Gemmataceae bacterium]MDW8263799.1 hypothetical protein [Gemmataceae bacterium]
MSEFGDGAPQRWRVYTLLIVVVAGMVTGRIFNTQRVYEPELARDPNDPADWRSAWPSTRPTPMPTFGSNDRSRWATIRALVDHGTYVIGRRDPAAANAQNPYGDSGIVFESGWETVDKVLHPERQEFYSSKPPLLPTLVAGEYALLKHLCGWSITEYPQRVVRVILLTVNLIPFVLYLVLLARLVERYSVTDWGRLYVMGVACFGTFLTTFAVTLNNHTVAAHCALFALYLALRIWNDGERSPALFLGAGFLTALTAAVELPALAFAAALTAALLWRSPRPTLCYFLPAALVPAAAFFLTNYLALGRWTPAYGEFGGPWYEYPGSHWLKARDGTPHGIDWAGERESRAAYVLHFLVGHHGLLSLTPVNVLALVGMVWASHRALRQWLRVRSANGPAIGPLAPLGVLTLVLTVVVTGFYLVRTSNYGGNTSGPRWLFWLTPFWLLTLLPVADWLATRRWGRGLGHALLLISVVSVSYPAWNPWRQPWLYQWMEIIGWIQY